MCFVFSRSLQVTLQCVVSLTITGFYFSILFYLECVRQQLPNRLLVTERLWWAVGSSACCRLCTFLQAKLRVRPTTKDKSIIRMKREMEVSYEIIYGDEMSERP